MRFRSLVVRLLILGAVVSTGGIARRAGAVDPPKCWDLNAGAYKTATKWLTSPGTLVGTPGDDVLVGSTGTDVIKGLGGNDVICSADDGAPEYTRTVNDLARFDRYMAPDTIDGGPGNDAIEGIGRLHGGAGDDVVHTYDIGPSNTLGSFADGGSGEDKVRGYGANAIGGSGSDPLVFTNNAIADGGSGNDHVEGYNAIALLGGSGSDSVKNLSGSQRIDCGAGYDQVIPGDATNVKRCEVDTTNP